MPSDTAKVSGLPCIFSWNKTDSVELSTLNATKTFGGLDDGEEQKSYRSEIAEP